jgi:ABC-type transport system involved in multi-copper enzyme maturation permease subunit
MFNIALNTFREIFRNKFFWLIGFLGLIFLLASFLLDTLAMGESRRVLFDFGLSFIEVTGVAIILFLWWSMLAREIDGRTIYLMLSKPIHRSTIIFGKFFGFFVLLCVLFIWETILFSAILLFKGFAIDGIFFLSIVGIFLKCLSLLALILFFSTFTSPILSIFMTGASYIIGHSGYIMLEYGLQSGDAILRTIAQSILIFFPNLESLNLKNLVATTAHIDLSLYLQSYLINGIYIILVLYLAGKLFEKRSFDAV